MLIAAGTFCEGERPPHPQGSCRHPLRPCAFAYQFTLELGAAITIAVQGTNVCQD